MSCGVGHRHGLDLALLWLWLWLWLAATALIRPLAWESPYAVEAALEKAKRQKKKNPKHFFFSFLGPHPRHMEVPRLGVQ